ncbi:MAG: hypothetical protein ACJ8CR_37160 [Roseiflexaceae bacterium]
MPTLRKLQEDEVHALAHKGNGIRAAIAMEYDGYLADFDPNDYGEALLAEGESKLNVRNRLRAAAERRGWVLELIRTQGSLVRFKVVSENGDEAMDVFGQGDEETETEQEMAVAA